MNELSKLEYIALKMLEGKTDLIRVNDEQKIKFIVEAFEFAKLFLDISEDKEMDWNKE